MPSSHLIESLELLGKSDAMQQLYKMIGRLCNLDCAVLLIGEEGSGRSVIARALHFFSHRASAPFNMIDGTKAAESTDEELLGIDETHNGDVTCFIENFAAISSFAQHQLISIYRRKEYRCTHNNRTRKHNFRFVASATENLRQDLENGCVPLDLFYDWNFVIVHVPALRDRREDIPLYANHFLTSAAAEMKLSRKELSPEAVQAIVSHDWPGNLIELRGTMRTALANCRGNYIRAEHLPVWKKQSSTEEAFSRLESFLDSKLSSYIEHSPHSFEGNLYRLLLSHAEKSLFEYALKKSNGNKNKAAELLGLHRNTLNKKLHKLLD